MITLSREKQQVFVAENWDECSKHMYELMRDGFVLTNLDFYNEFYIVVMDKGSSWNNQEILFSADFPQLEINDYWDKGLDITYVAADNLTWMIFFSAGTGISGQEWYFKNTFEEIKGSINSLWQQRKVITDLRKSFGGIVVVMSGGFKWNQMWSLTDSWPYQAIREEQEKNNRVITHLCQLDKKCFMVMSGGTGIRHQEIARVKEFISAEEELDKAWGNGMMVTTAAFGNEELVLVFSR
jgi:hypothetical protein